MKATTTIRIIDFMGIHTETRGKARYLTVKTYRQAEEIIAEQVALGNRAEVMV